MKQYSRPHFQTLTTLAALLYLALGCSGGGSGASSSGLSAATNAHAVITKVSTGIVGAGSSIGQTAVGQNAITAMFIKRPLLMNLLLPQAYASTDNTSDWCSIHAEPLTGDGVTLMNSSSADYPALAFFCLMKYNTGDPDSVQGSYSLMNGIVCALTNGGLTWDSTLHTISIRLDTDCFTSAQLTNMNISSPPQTISGVSVTASVPAAFNNYYDAGLVFTLPAPFSMSITLGSKIVGTKSEFVVFENQNAQTANKTDSYAASFDTSTGILMFESRFDRLFASTSGSCGTSCGFSRHRRILATLAVDSTGNPTGLTSLQGLDSNVNVSGGLYAGRFNTIDGDVSSGIIARTFGASGLASAQDLAVGANWAEVTNTKCYGTSSNALGTCGNGVSLPNTFAFSGGGSAVGTGYVTPAIWVNSLTAGLNFSSGVTTADTQY